jgi:Na+-driven multidrug efflux pump
VSYHFRSNSPDVVALTAVVLPLTCAHIIPDGVQGTAGGIVRGCGRQTLGMECESVGKVTTNQEQV